MEEKRSGPVTPRAATTTTPLQSFANDSARRRIALHHALKRRRRISNALDILCGVDRGRAPVPYSAGGMNLDWRQRERAGGVEPE